MAHRIGGKWLDDLNQDLSGSERSCAVLAGAILDDRIMVLLKQYLLAPKTKTDELFGRSRAIEPFSPRISLARRLGLISDETHRALDWIREIRNDAAHNPEFTFEESANADRVKNVVSVLKLQERAPSLLKPPYDSTRGYFVAATIMLVAALELEARDLSPTTRRPIDALKNFKLVERS